MHASSLASIVRVQTWPKVDDDEPLALFHDKFWGKSMKDEEEKWRNTQPLRADEDGDESMDQNRDETITMNMDNDFIPGCYVLDLGIPGLLCSSIWIRADYIRVYDYFQTFYNKYNKPMTRVPSAVLTGQPGIGKSVWIYYAARRCAAETKPFIWFYRTSYYLFVEEGVYKLPSDWEHRHFRHIIWALIDSGESEGVPPCLIPHGTLLFVIYVSSPPADRWLRMNKTTRSIVVIMNPWGREEREFVFLPCQPMLTFQRAFSALLSPLMTITETHLNENFDLFGPIPRLCVDSSCELEQYKCTVNAAILYITVDRLQKLAKSALGLSSDSVWDKLCLLSRQRRDDVSSLEVVTPISHSIKSRLSIQFRDLDLGELVHLYFEWLRESKGIAGILYEAIVQSYLRDGKFLEVFPMVTLEVKKEEETQHKWYSSHILIHNRALEASRRKALNQWRRVDIHSTHIHEYTDDGLQSIEPNTLYIPEATNQKALDSFILLDGLLYIFQIAVGPKHDIDQGLINVADQFSFPPMDRWCFVFIVPPNTTLTVSRPWRLALRDLSLYSAVVECGLQKTRA